jgi:glycine/D-amino acid oxidase-like deaminating enzyme
LPFPSGILSRVRGSPGTDVVVVGAGIVGASVAYHAACAGAAVLLIDRSLPASGVTGDSFAWVRGPSARAAIDGSTPLRRTALEDWTRLERDVPGVLVRWSGSLAWGEEARSHDDMLGADERLVDADEIRRLEPNLRAVLREAIWRPRDGAVDPVAVTEALIDAARRHGAQVRLGESVRGLRMQDGAVVGVDTSMGTFASRTVVLAAGVEVPTLCAAVGVDLPIAASPAVLMRFDASPGLLRRLLHCPWGDFRQTKDGMLLAAAGTANKDELQRSAHATLQRLKDMLSGAHDIQLSDVRIGVRPMPVDGLPIIGSLPGHPGGYIAVMHSAVTLAPAAGRLVADELIDALDLEELQGVRPNRFVTAAETARASSNEPPVS